MSASAQWSDAAVLGMLWRADALRQTATQIACSYGVSRNAVLIALHSWRLERHQSSATC